MNILKVHSLSKKLCKSKSELVLSLLYSNCLLVIILSGKWKLQYKYAVEKCKHGKIGFVLARFPTTTQFVCFGHAISFTPRFSCVITDVWESERTEKLI